MSAQEKLQQIVDSGQTVTVTLSNDKPSSPDADQIQQVTGRIVSTNSPDVVELQPAHGAPVPVPVTRILMVE